MSEQKPEQPEQFGDPVHRREPDEDPISPHQREPEPARVEQPKQESDG